MPGGTTTPVFWPPALFFQGMNAGTVVRAPIVLVGNGTLPEVTTWSGMASSARSAEYDRMGLAEIQWLRTPSRPVVTPPKGATVEYQMSGYDLHTALAWHYTANIDGWDIAPPFVDIRQAPWSSTPPSPVTPSVASVASWSRIDGPKEPITDELWFGLKDGPPQGVARAESGVVPLTIPSESFVLSPRVTFLLTASAGMVTGGVAVSPDGMSSTAPSWALLPATAMWRPWKYRFVYPSGMWNLRQRQSLTGNAGGWPLRQRQNGGATGSWPLRQRQTGT